MLQDEVGIVERERIKKVLVLLQATAVQVAQHD